MGSSWCGKADESNRHHQQVQSSTEMRTGVMRPNRVLGEVPSVQISREHLQAGGAVVVASSVGERLRTATSTEGNGRDKRHTKPYRDPDQVLAHLQAWRYGRCGVEAHWMITRRVA